VKGQFCAVCELCVPFPSSACWHGFLKPSIFYGERIKKGVEKVVFMPSLPPKVIYFAHINVSWGLVE
jgi:hypothetical protein